MSRTHEEFLNKIHDGKTAAAHISILADTVDPSLSYAGPREWTGRNAIHTAVFRENLDIIRDFCNILKDTASDEVKREQVRTAIKSASKDGLTPLMLNALKSPNAEITALLLDAGADPNVCMTSGEWENFNSLHAVSYEVNADVAIALLKAGADPSRLPEGAGTWDDRFNVLHRFTDKNVIAVVKAVCAIENKAQLAQVINGRNKDGFTPLLVSLKESYTEIAVQLVQAGADLSLSCDKAGKKWFAYNALHLASERNNVAVIRAIKAKDPSSYLGMIDSRILREDGDYPSFTPLLMAMINQHWEVVIELVQMDADPSLQVTRDHSCKHTWGSWGGNWKGCNALDIAGRRNAPFRVMDAINHANHANYKKALRVAGLVSQPAGSASISASPQTLFAPASRAVEKKWGLLNGESYAFEVAPKESRSALLGASCDTIQSKLLGCIRDRDKDLEKKNTVIELIANQIRKDGRGLYLNEAIQKRLARMHDQLDALKKEREFSERGYRRILRMSDSNVGLAEIVDLFRAAGRPLDADQVERLLVDGNARKQQIEQHLLSFVSEVEVQEDYIKQNVVELRLSSSLMISFALIENLSLRMWGAGSGDKMTLLAVVQPEIAEVGPCIDIFDSGTDFRKLKLVPAPVISPETGSRRTREEDLVVVGQGDPKRLRSAV
ncbi:MAG: hypothetical protein NTW94_00955 [Legionellales bacterium]|nr:hypothetical protein [Legionellales bacterium]